MMITLNDILMTSVYRAMSEANQKEFASDKEREKYQMKRSAEIYEELKKEYGFR